MVATFLDLQSANQRKSRAVDGFGAAGLRLSVYDYKIYFADDRKVETAMATYHTSAEDSATV